MKGDSWGAIQKGGREIVGGEVKRDSHRPVMVGDGQSFDDVKVVIVKKKEKE